MGEKLKTSILMTLCDREPEVILACLRSIWRSLPVDCELVIVNDGSKMDYEWLRDYCQARFNPFVWIEAGDYEAFRIEGGFNNPARAFNLALDAAKGEKLIVMSSDVIVTPVAMKAALKVRHEEMIWTPKVWDLESQAEYCGPSRVFPMPWFLVCSRAKAIECGGWDEEYLLGMCYEDNDFVGRIAALTGRIAYDWNAMVYHVSHDQPAYRVENADVRDANKRNNDYTQQKWKGIPFNRELTPFDIVPEAHPSGIRCMKVIMQRTGLDEVIAKTKRDRTVPQIAMRAGVGGRI